jgi:hypothetical protein
LGGLLLVWGVAAYVIIPFVWKQYMKRHPTLDRSPRVTQTRTGHSGDPLNVILFGTQAQLESVMQAAGWYPAKPLGLRSDLKIAVDTVLSHPDTEAPVSDLYLFGRPQDRAFEQPVGHSPRSRHHVRFWQTELLTDDGRPGWIGAAVYDEHVGLSRVTGQITHVTAPDVDAERDYLFDCLESAGGLQSHRSITGFHTRREGRNGGGNLWHTDGNLYLGVLRDPDLPSSSLDASQPATRQPSSMSSRRP